MRKQIDNEQFTVRFIFIMNGLGIKTVGQANKFLAKCSDHVKINDIRAIRLKKELNDYLLKY